VADGLHRSRAGLAAVTIVLSAWFGWFLLAEVGIYQTAPAHLQAERDIQAVEATVEARVLINHMAIGREVGVGDILIELEDTAVRLKRAEHQASLNAARAQLHAIEAEIAAEEQALADMRGATPVAQAEMRRRYQQAQAAAQLAEEELARWRTLHKSGSVAELQVVERETAARRRRIEVEELRLAIDREGRDRRAGEADRRARIERLRRDAAELAGLIATTTEVVRQLEHEGERYRVRAPVSGPLAEVADLQPGMIVRSGERLATIVPTGALKVTADFSPTAVGRIRPGQPAWLRLDGFPWSQYGRVMASVRRVAHEPRAGKIRVELTIPPRHVSIPLQHGLPGIVEIEVERASPAVLVLRAAGALLRSTHAKGGE
jgi:membrane fusion protein (multidrug efflux system)